MHEALQCFSKEFYMTSVQHLMQKWKKCADNEHGKNVPIIKETLWKNNLNFVHNVPMMYANFTIIVTTFFEKKIGDITFICPIHDGLVPDSIHCSSLQARTPGKWLQTLHWFQQLQRLHILHVCNILYINHTRRNIYWPNLHESMKHSFFLQVGYETQTKFYYWHFLIRISISESQHFGYICSNCQLYHI